MKKTRHLKLKPGESEMFFADKMTEAGFVATNFFDGPYLKNLADRLQMPREILYLRATRFVQKRYIEFKSECFLDKVFGQNRPGAKNLWEINPSNKSELVKYLKSFNSRNVGDL